MEQTKAKTSNSVLSSGRRRWAPITDQSQQSKVIKALSHPLRKWIYEELGKGAVRQAELTRKASQAFRRTITHKLMRHHLRLLEHAGLVGSRTEMNRINVLYRRAEVCVMISVDDEESQQFKNLMTQEVFERIVERVLRETGVTAQLGPGCAGFRE